MNFFSLAPLKYIFKVLKHRYMGYVMYHNPRILKSILYHDKFGKWIDWNHPRDLNEKINWLAFNTDTTLWTKCADKFRMREYVKECGCEEILVPLYGVWKKASDIEFDKLPEKFVLKTNHGCGGVFIVKDKSKLNIESTVKKLQKHLDTPFGYKLAEPHYLGISPCVVCEMLLEDGVHEHPVDYKIYCFNGEPCYIWTTSDRVIETHELKGNLFDTEWNRLNHFMAEKFRNNVEVEKPFHLSEMLEYARKLATPFPQVRCDFYEIGNHVYIGELTFTSRAGLIGDFTPDALRIMGNQIILPPKKKEGK